MESVWFYLLCKGFNLFLATGCYLGIGAMLAALFCVVIEDMFELESNELLGLLLTILWPIAPVVLCADWAYRIIKRKQ